MRSLLILLTLCSPCLGQAVWKNQTYTRPVCTNPNCPMCWGKDGIVAQLTAQAQARNYAPTNGIKSGPVVSVPTTTNTDTPTVVSNSVDPPVQSGYWITQRVKRCNGRTCWYENVRTFVRTSTPVQTVPPPAFESSPSSSPTKTPSTPPLPPPQAQAPTPQEAVDELLRIIQPSQSDVLYDIGSGDGRFLITAAIGYGCRAVGIELDPTLVQQANQLAKEYGVTNKITVYEGDALKYDLSDLNLVVMYLYPDLMDKVLAQLPSGCRVYSYMHSIPGSIEYKVGDHVFYEWVKA